MVARGDNYGVGVECFSGDELYICTRSDIYIYIYVSFQFWLFICKIISSFAFLTLTVLVKA